MYLNWIAHWIYLIELTVLQIDERQNRCYLRNGIFFIIFAKCVLVSKCGLTPQYTQLQELYDKYKEQDFVVIGFPCNDFMEQEPGTAEEILSFCEVNYGVTFPLN